MEHKISAKSPQELPILSVNNKERLERKATGRRKKLAKWVAKSQITISICTLMLLVVTHACSARVRQHTSKFFELSYYNADSGEYSIGWNDAWMVIFWIVFFTGLRASTMGYILKPMAQRGGIKSQRKQVRFAEQAWLSIYCSVFWTIGIYIWKRSSYWVDMKELWTNWPTREISGLQKWYILVQYAFWLQQILVINLEERRKDYWQMLCHHVVTTSLLFASYGYHQTKVANVILCATDIVDIIFPMAKCLKYLGFTTIVDILFGVFMITWIMSRHVLYLMVCYSVWTDIPATIAYGCYQGNRSTLIGPFPAPNRFLHLLEPFHDPEGIVCFNHKIKWAFLSLLLLLQCLMLLWFCMIVKVAIMVVRGGQAEEIRSDDEDCADIYNHKQLAQTSRHVLKHGDEVIDGDAIGRPNYLTYSGSAKHRKTKQKASGVSMHGQKELVRRVGCDKEHQVN